MDIPQLIASPTVSLLRNYVGSTTKVFPRDVEVVNVNLL